jgi:hypothetical protein
LHGREAKKALSATVFAVITSRDHIEARGVTNKVKDKKETKRNKRQLLQERQTKKVNKMKWTEKNCSFSTYHRPGPAHVNMNFWYREKYLAIKVKALTVVFRVMIPTTNAYRMPVSVAVRSKA